jgi:hypothetical protein
MGLGLDERHGPVGKLPEGDAGQRLTITPINEEGGSAQPRLTQFDGTQLRLLGR